MPFSDQVKGHGGQNPFSDSQARNFSDDKVTSEFLPISLFWTLFNDQHEILLGSRGCGKTFLLKMMRYSMIKTVEDSRAAELVKKKEFIALYVPMHLEFVAPLNGINSEKMQILLFQVLFNCLLANSIMVELNSMLEEVDDVIEKARKRVSLVKKLDNIWFGDDQSEICDFEDLREKIDKMYYNIDWINFNETSIPVVFRRQICSTLLSVKNSISHILEFKTEPTWIICIDEAEFLNEICQKCINNIFRSDSNRIALKVATLPFYHKTLATLEEGISVSDGNDFSYKIVDMDYNSSDFIRLTDKLCRHRINNRFKKNSDCNSLEDFVGKIGNDDYIDYYREIVKDDRASYEVIEKEIIKSFPEKRRENAPNYSNLRKTVYDKYAPIFFLREVHKIAKKGNNKPGWFAGVKTIRKVSQGNPRMFIQIMCSLFDKARETKLTTRAQHDVIYKFACDICESTKALQKNGPEAYKKLNAISEKIQEKVHGMNLVTGGLNFTVSDGSYEWLEVAIAYSRVITDDETKRRGISKSSKLMLSCAYAVKYWLPIRSDVPISIPELEDINTNSYTVKGKIKKKNYVDPNQLTIFEVMRDEANKK
ncbi:MAG: hypothetical protein OSJ53_04965 [Kineothrix sp.]|nr:hypothetical protein [Kineothrix sp.]